MSLFLTFFNKLTNVVTLSIIFPSVYKQSWKTFLELLIESPGGYSNVELREETLVIVLAGTDTSAVGTAFTTVMLSKYPDIQEKVWEE